MNSQLLLPPNIVETHGPVIFLAGPVQGAPDWQAAAVIHIQQASGSIHIASPRKDYAPGEFVHEKQLDWETCYLRQAAREGVILFWLAREVEHLCDRCYAQTTRFELAEWKVRHERDGARIVVGIEQGFSGARYIRRRLEQDCPGIPIFTSLAETCAAAVAKIRQER